MRLLLLLLFLQKVDLFIQNQHLPICANCKFYGPNNKCTKFGKVNIITGEHNYESADSVRKDKEKCGEYAIYYKKNDNQNLPICANCKFYGPNDKCTKFGEVNIITGKYNYESADSVRNNEEKCGEYAIYYKKNDFKFITIPLKITNYILTENYVIILTFLFVKIFLDL